MRNTRVFLAFATLPCLILALACSSGDSGTPDSAGAPHDPFQPLTPGAAVAPGLSQKDAQDLAAIQPELDAVADLDAAGFAKRYALPWHDALGYDPLTASGLDLVQQSPFALSASESQILGQRGFVLSGTQRFPSFVYGYESLYLADLPLYVSADSILYALHQSYDDLLETIETSVLIPDLTTLLDGMRSELGSGAGADLDPSARADADLYLTVAKSLLAGELQPSTLGGSGAKELFDAAMAASGEKEIALFDAKRHVDFSQFEPRGHYTDSEQLSNYFRAMIWLGRIDFRIIETQPDQSQVFYRRQLEGAYVLRSLVTSAALAKWKRVHDTIGAFVGEPDNMTLPELDGLLSDLGLSSAAGLAGLSDAKIAQAIVDGGYGLQRIASRIMINGLPNGTMPLASAFLLFGQRYVIDSHVFSNVVYDRVQHGSVYRMMPNPLDVGFAALGNDQAGLLLAPELEKYPYAPDLASMRILADAHPAAFWKENLYNLWLGGLRALAPTPDVADPAQAGLPAVAGTEAWGRRLLETELASWAELRHDTILYAKQSYTGGASCEFPDAYVEPYPELFARLEAYAAHGSELATTLDLGSNALAANVKQHFEDMASVMVTLRQMAEEQRSGTPHSAEQIAFINQAVKIQQGCGDPVGQEGWYAKLFLFPSSGIELDPTIADVHTQPTDEGGDMVGRVLHVGTGMPRLMVVTVNTCVGPRAYVGLASSYYEKITENFERLDDQQWSSELQQTPPPDVPWMADLISN
jgi:Protein of unknown function (DUF3160)